MRRLKRGSKKLERLVDKYPELQIKDTVWATVNYVKPKTVIDIEMPVNQLPDSFIWRNGDARLIRVVRGDSVFYTVICDTVTVTNRVEIPVDRVQPVKYVDKPLKWWQVGLMWIGGIGLVVLILILIRNLSYIGANRF